MYNLYVIEAKKADYDEVSQMAVIARSAEEVLDIIQVDNPMPELEYGDSTFYSTLQRRQELSVRFICKTDATKPQIVCIDFING